MEYYESDDDYTKEQIERFLKWFNENIGTDYELNESASGIEDGYYVVFMDLKSLEVAKIAKFEHHFKEELENE